MARPGIRLRRSVHDGLLRGAQTIVSAVRPTLGPDPRVVAVAAAKPVLKPELLDDGAQIARGIIQLADSEADVGAMLVRQMLWQLQEDVGDGSATAAVIFESLLTDGLNYVAAGGNSMELRTHLQEGLADLVAHLETQRRPVEDFTALARSVCADPELAEVMGEIMTTLGPYANVDIVAGQGRRVHHDIILGTFWKSSGLLASTQSQITRAELHDAVIIATDFDLESPQELEPMLRHAIRAGAGSLVVVARSLSDKVRGFIASARPVDTFHVLCVKTPGQDVISQMQSLHDLALLTGGQPLFQSAGQTSDSVSRHNLGRVKRAWATQDNFGIEDGAADEARLNACVAAVQTQIDACTHYRERSVLYDRLSRFLGASAIVHVGGSAPSEIKLRRADAVAALRTLRASGIEGVVPGGGSALLRASQALSGSEDNEVARAAQHMLKRALEAPTRSIATNAGIEPGCAIGQLQSIDNTDAPLVFDARTRSLRDAWESGILDSAPVITAAVRAAVTTAALCLTIDVVVDHRQPELAVTP